MGAPFSPVLVDLFMGYHDKNWLQKFDINESSTFVQTLCRYFLLICKLDRC